jgi:hypothetical protein
VLILCVSRRCYAFEKNKGSEDSKSKGKAMSCEFYFGVSM